MYLNTVPGAKGVYLTTDDTLNQAVSLTQIHHMAMGAQLPDTSKPRHQFLGRGARDPRPAPPDAPGPDRALLLLTMKQTAHLPTTLAGENQFIVEGLIDDIIPLAANVLAAVKDTWVDALGHPRERRDTLTADFMDHLVQITSPREELIEKIVMKVIDWTVIYRPPVIPTVTLTCYQHTWWVAQWQGTGTTRRV